MGLRVSDNQGPVGGPDDEEYLFGHPVHGTPQLVAVSLGKVLGVRIQGFRGFRV